MGYKNIDDYIQNPSQYGALVGRTSGRICEGKVLIEGKEYSLNKNYNPHQGHRGQYRIQSKIMGCRGYRGR